MSTQSKMMIDVIYVGKYPSFDILSTLQQHVYIDEFELYDCDLDFLRQHYMEHSHRSHLAVPGIISYAIGTKQVPEKVEANLVIDSMISIANFTKVAMKHFTMSLDKENLVSVNKKIPNKGMTPMQIISRGDYDFDSEYFLHPTIGFYDEKKRKRMLLYAKNRVNALYHYALDNL